MTTTDSGRWLLHVRVDVIARLFQFFCPPFVLCRGELLEDLVPRTFGVKWMISAFLVRVFFLHFQTPSYSQRVLGPGSRLGLVYQWPAPCWPFVRVVHEPDGVAVQPFIVH